MHIPLDFNPVEEMKTLSGQLLDIEGQVKTDRMFSVEMRHEEQNRATIFRPGNSFLRASTPHVVSVQHQGNDRFVKIEGVGGFTSTQVVPSTRYTPGFLFNVGLDIVKLTLRSDEGLPKEIENEFLAGLEDQKVYSGLGDCFSKFSVACLKDQGSFIVNIDNTSERAEWPRKKLSALFSGVTGSVDDSYKKQMQGLSGLSYALKIQQQAREKGIGHKMMEKGLDILETPDLQGWCKMLLKLDI